ncbi:MAG TPA: phosphoribosylanthranilate isomerase [Nitrospirae bacterium]|nr:phosphoribosylanthranilate isomerase [Nitrospirota bacterium]
MTRVKICGITNLEDARLAVEYGADALGFVFYEGSPRHVFPETVREIISHLPPFVTTVGVFVNAPPQEIRELMDLAGLDVVQLHGDEPQEECSLFPRVIKAFRVRELSDIERLKGYSVSAYLLDAYDPEVPGGTGQTFNWDIAVEAKKYGPIILAGGLTPENVADAVSRVRPYAVDVSSGVEAQKGKKDPEKMRLFIERVKKIHC